MSTIARVARCTEIPAGGKLVVEVEGRSIVLFHTGGSYYAIDDLCTHDGGPLAEGPLCGDEIECPRHGARFNVRTGKALCLPAVDPVTTHTIHVRGDELFLEIDD